MTRKIATATACVGLLAGAAALAVEAGSSEQAGAGREAERSALGRFLQGRVGRLLVLRSELDLTEAQRGQVRSVLQAHRGEIVEALKSLSAGKRALRDAVAAEKPDEQKIRAAAGELGRALGEAAVLAAKVRGEIRPLLTDEQLKLLGEFRADNDAAVDGLLKKWSEAK